MGTYPWEARHGGWVATATELVRFAVAVDGLDEAGYPAPRLADGDGDAHAAWFCLRERMGRQLAGPPVARRQSAGHAVPPGEDEQVRAHPDSEPGAFCWAALTNTRLPDRPGAGAWDELMWNIVRRVRVWPNTDLF